MVQLDKWIDTNIVEKIDCVYTVKVVMQIAVDA